MKTTIASRKFTITGGLLTIMLILLIVGVSLKCLTRQSDFAMGISKINHQLNQVHRAAITVYQLDIARIRYRRTGLNIFRLAFQQIGDSLSTQIKELHYLTKDDSIEKACVVSVSMGIKDLQGYWLSPANYTEKPGGKNKLRVAMEEETKIAGIQSDLNTISQGYTHRFNNLFLVNQKTMKQTQQVIIFTAALILLILLCMLMMQRVMLKKMKTDEDQPVP
ncbi:hypothetical protein [Mucilaginibacter boryungensis]|uniref:Chemoreceptor-like protein with four helix bundle sensory module n=1 Tax=Mucilaginibacter boryungensis TaxID=768480 RepID=A0ABR9XEI7_9SPHI|nr:hypothetical protein [Mucilaginibacter boryungensis]MBE9665686.1 hypothetical protein [Mucilaginibacter boryungensis]